jgi:hypothetical protein
MAPTDAPQYQALARLGGVASDVGFKFAEKMKEEETDAQIAQYYADRKIRSNAMQKTLSSITDPEEIESEYSRWLESEQEAFDGARLNNRARRAIANNNEGFYAETQIGVANHVRKSIIQNADNTWVDVQNMAVMGDSHTLDDGTVIGGSQLYDYATDKRVSLGEISYEDGEKMKMDFESNSNYHKLNAQLAALDESFARGMPVDDYVDGLNSVKEEADRLGLKENSRNQLKTTATYRVSNAVGREVKGADKALSDMRVAIKTREFSREDQLKIEEKLGPKYAQIIADSQEEALRSLAISDEAAADLVKILDSAIANKDADDPGFIAVGWPDAIDKMDKVSNAGELKYVAALVLADNYIEMAQEGKDLRAYEGWRKNDKWVKSDGLIQRVVSGVAFYTRENGPSSGFVNGTFSAVVDWRKDKMYKGEKIDTEEELLQKLFGSQAKELSQSIPAPQVQPEIVAPESDPLGIF